MPGSGTLSWSISSTCDTCGSVRAYAMPRFNAVARPRFSGSGSHSTSRRAAQAVCTSDAGLALSTTTTRPTCAASASNSAVSSARSGWWVTTTAHTADSGARGAAAGSGITAVPVGAPSTLPSPFEGVRDALAPQLDPMAYAPGLVADEPFGGALDEIGHFGFAEHDSGARSRRRVVVKGDRLAERTFRTFEGIRVTVIGDVVGLEQQRIAEFGSERKDPLPRVRAPEFDGTVPVVLPVPVEINEQVQPPVHRQATMPVEIGVDLQIPAAANGVDAAAAQLGVGLQAFDPGEVGQDREECRRIEIGDEITGPLRHVPGRGQPVLSMGGVDVLFLRIAKSEEHTSELQSPVHLVCR